MKFGIRECCDVVFRAKSTMQLGKKVFYKDEPVIYFDTLKTSSLEGAATTVYAQGGRGNARLMSWDGERTMTFTMEDALISPIGLTILSGAGLIEADSNQGTVIVQHITETTQAVTKDGTVKLYTKEKPHTIAATDVAFNSDNYIYVMKLDDNGEVISEPYLYYFNPTTTEAAGYGWEITVKTHKTGGTEDAYLSDYTVADGDRVLIDYYTDRTANAYQIDITPDKFGGAFYIEASTLWRDQATQKDMPAELIIPSGRIQSNFTFTMASSGDPSSFTFTVDAFPDYTRFNKDKKVLATIQVFGLEDSNENKITRVNTKSYDKVDDEGIVTLDPAIENNVRGPKTGS